MQPAHGSELELIHEGSSGYRHYLDGKAVHVGSMLELLIDDGWISGRYEWLFSPDAQPYLVNRLDTGNDQAVILDSYAQLRWPQ